MRDALAEELDGKAPRPFAESLRIVDEELRKPLTASPPDKGGRRKGSRVVMRDGKRVVVPPEEIERAAERVDDPYSDVLSTENFKIVLSPVCDTVESLFPGVKIEDGERAAGAALHASAFKNHAPDFMKKYADLIMCVGWWFGIAMKAGVKQQLTQGVTVEEKPGTDKETVPPAREVGRGALSSH